MNSFKKTKERILSLHQQIIYEFDLIKIFCKEDKNENLKQKINNWNYLYDNMQNTILIEENDYSDDTFSKYCGSIKNDINLFLYDYSTIFWLCYHEKNATFKHLKSYLLRKYNIELIDVLVEDDSYEVDLGFVPVYFKKEKKLWKYICCNCGDLRTVKEFCYSILNCSCKFENNVEEIGNLIKIYIRNQFFLCCKICLSCQPYCYNKKIKKQYCEKCEQRQVEERKNFASNGEFFFYFFQKEQKLQFKKQHMFKNCIYKIKPCRFDFFSQKLNLVVEIHGLQHYKAVPFFEKYRRFDEQVESDNYKKEWCKKNNINYIELKYDPEIYNWQELMLDEFKKKCYELEINLNG